MYFRCYIILGLNARVLESVSYTFVYLATRLYKIADGNIRRCKVGKIYFLSPIESVNLPQSCVISGFRREVGENCVLQGHYAPSSTSYATRYVMTLKNAVLSYIKVL